jgi:cell filamentation protein
VVLGVGDLALYTNQDDYNKTRNYWKYLRAKLKKEKSELASVTTQLKLFAKDGKRYLTDMLDYTGIIT